MAHWRNTWKPARFFFLDARSALPLLAAALHIRLWTILTALAVVLIFWWLERVGLTFPSAIRSVRRSLSGPLRPPRRRQKRRYPVDYGRSR